jgi:hypothetical protein
MDRAAGVAIGERSVGADAGDVAVLRAEEAVAGADEAVLDQGAEGDARFCLLARLDLDVLGAERADIGDAAGGDLDVISITLEANEVAAEKLGDVPKNGSRITSPGLVVPTMMRWSRASGFCVGCDLRPSSPFSRSPPEQIGKVHQSERAWMSSLPAFSAS